MIDPPEEKVNSGQTWQVFRSLPGRKHSRPRPGVFRPLPFRVEWSHVPRFQRMKEMTMSDVLQPDRLREALKQVIDPEIYENIVDLGLVYAVDVLPEAQVRVTMTLTTPHCPMGPEIIENVQKVITSEGAGSVDVNIVWEPMWTPEMMTPELKAQLGIGVEEPKLEIELPPPPPPVKKKKGLLSRIFGG